MWGKIKDAFDFSKERWERDLREAEARADKYMRLADEAEARGDERMARKYEKEFMKALGEAKHIRKYELHNY